MPSYFGPDAKRGVMRLRVWAGLGDSVHALPVLAEIKAHSPKLRVEIVCKMGHDSLFEGHALPLVPGRDEIDGRPFDYALELGWIPPAEPFDDSPGTISEQWVRNVFGWTPHPDRWGYHLNISDDLAARARELAATFGTPDAAGRYPIAVIHHDGLSDRRRKQIRSRAFATAAEDLLARGITPIVIDNERRSPLRRIPGVVQVTKTDPLWNGIGTGEAGTLAALGALAQIVIGIDSGPGHVAAATTSGRDLPAAPRTLIVMKRNHPYHYFAPADHVTHLVPHTHERRLYGDAKIGAAFFREHYRSIDYGNPIDGLRYAVAEILDGPSPVIYAGGSWTVKGSERERGIDREITKQDVYGLKKWDRPRPKTVVDIGCHFGYFARQAKKRWPRAEVIGVDVDPDCIEAARRNCPPTVELVNAAVCYDRHRPLEFRRCHVRRSVNVVGVPGHPTDVERREKMVWEAEPLTAERITLAEILDRYQIDRLDVLKLDCEGAEREILTLEPDAVLARVGVVLLEWHGPGWFNELVARRFGRECYQSWFDHGDIGMGRLDLSSFRISSHAITPQIRPTQNANAT